MRSALRQRESDLQYREVAAHFARLDIHPGYLAELAREPIKPTSGIVAKENATIPVLTHAYAAIDYISFGTALLGLIVALSTAIMYYSRTSSVGQHAGATVSSPLPDPNLLRLDESVRRLSIALATVVSSMQERSHASTEANSKTAEVIVQKANLRIAPDRLSSAVMAVGLGTNLLVDSEEKDWLRVFAPNGELVWIAKELVSDGTEIPSDINSISHYHN